MILSLIAAIVALTVIFLIVMGIALCFLFVISFICANVLKLFCKGEG